MIQSFNDFYQLLFESPLYTNAIYLEVLNDQIQNKAFAKTAIDYPSFDRINDINIKIHDFPGPLKTLLFIKDSEIKATMIYNVIDNEFYTYGIWQSRATPKLIWDFITNYIPKKYKAVYSDNVMNQLGKKFWKKLLNYFMQNNYKMVISYKDNRRIQEEPYLSESFEDYFKSQTTDNGVVLNSNKIFKVYF